MPSRARNAKLAAATAGVAAGVAAAAVAANPVVRDEARRLARLARPLGVRERAAPVPPPLPPGHIVHLPGRGEVFVRDTGSSLPPVLLLHGWTVSADLNFFRVYDDLAEAYRVIALDHRGHGRGMRALTAFSLEECADDAAALLRTLGTPPAILAGYSMGGAIEMLLWHRHPELVAGMVFCATALEWQASTRERLVWRGMSIFEVALRMGTGDGLVERAVREAVEECPELEPVEPWVTAEFHRGHPVALAGAGRALSTYDGRPLAAGVDVPCAVVVTTRDPLVRPVKQRQLAEALRAPIFELDADHQAPFNRGRAFTAALRAATDDVATRAGVGAGSTSRTE